MEQFLTDMKNSKELLSLLNKEDAAATVSLPRKRDAAELLDDLLALLFPVHFRDRIPATEDRSAALVRIEQRLIALIQPLTAGKESNGETITAWFLDQLPAIRSVLLKDAEAINAGDPAAHSVDEVILAYPGFAAVAAYRFAHALHRLGVPILPRLITEVAHERTAVDIHPGAEIGASFVIDHGTGIVIGESTVIGDHVKIYQGVTLGALSVEKTMARSKRHPTIEDHVVVYAHAVILGGETVVGHHSVIGGNVWLTESVPPHSVVYHERNVIVHDRLAGSGELNWVI